MDTYKFSVTTTGSHTIPVKGNFLRYKEVTNSAVASTIKIKTDAGDTLVMDPGEKCLLPHIFTRIEITNDDASETIEGRLLIGEGDYDSASVTGTVSVSALPGKVADNADGQSAVGAGGILAVLGRIQAWNGATWDRIVGVTVDSVKSLAVVCAGTLGRIAQAAIGGVNTLIVSDRGYTYGANYSASNALAANTPETVFSAASNTNGAILWDCDFTFVNTGGTTTSAVFIAKASAPTTNVDGQAICSVDNATVSGAGNAYASGKRVRPVFIAAGLGLYFINGAAEAAAYRRANYTLL